MSNNISYSCAFCGTNYDNIEKRMQCEKVCFNKERVKQQQTQKEELCKVKKIRQDELCLIENQIKDLYKTYQEKINKYYMDYYANNQNIIAYRVPNSIVVKDIFDIYKF